MIAALRDADAVIVAASPVTRAVMSACEGLKVVVRTGVGYDVIDVPGATELGVIAVNVPDIWVREVANHALPVRRGDRARADRSAPAQRREPRGVRAGRGAPRTLTACFQSSHARG
jgi:phosphoglycerate dehydrogenase-like enzyme